MPPPKKRKNDNYPGMGISINLNQKTREPRNYPNVVIDEYLEKKGSQRKKQKSHKEVFQNVMIKDRVVKPVELYLHDPLELSEKGSKKMPLEVLEHFDPEDDSYETRPFKPEDGMMHYLLNKPRKIIRETKVIKEYNLRYLICVTMYNESRDDLLSTLQGIYDNIPHFLDAGICSEEIAVCVMCDGILSLDKSCVDYFKELDLQMKHPEVSITNRLNKIYESHKQYIEDAKDPREQNRRKIDIAKTLPPSIPRKTAIVYQTRISGEDLPNSKGCLGKYYAKRATEKLNVFFCVKIINKGKLSSHLWFFAGFCKSLRPEFTCLIDCGTVPDQRGVYNYFRVLETRPQVGGVCGYMGCRIPWCPYVIKMMKYIFCCGCIPKKKNKPAKVQTMTSLKKKKTDVDSGKKRCSLFYYILYSIAWLVSTFFNSILKIVVFILNVYMTIMERIFTIENAQLFEYTFAHIFDKAFESMFGFIAVLPGAWSAYRWEALDKDELLEKEYLKTVLDPDYSYKTVKEANQILAEDRLLCLAIFTKRNENYTLTYAPDAVARTDVIDSLIGLLMQRKRWINGTWYAMQHVLNFMNKIRFSSHSTWQQFLFRFSQAITKLSIFLTYLLIGIYFSTMHITVFTLIGDWILWENTVETRYVSEEYKMQSAAGLAVFVYIVIVVSLIFYSLQVSARQAPFAFRLICHTLGLYMLASFGAFVWIILDTILFENKKYFAEADQITYLLIINVGCYALTIILSPTSIPLILRSLLSYLYFMPSYMHSFLIYAFCRIDDLSWGTKGADASEENRKTLDFKHFKVDFVSTWMILNALVAFIIVYLNTISVTANYFYLGLGYFVTAFMAFKTIIAVIFQLKFNFFDKPLMWCRMRKGKKEYQKISEEIKNFYEKELCVTELKKEDQPPKDDNLKAAPSLLDSQESEEEYSENEEDYMSEDEEIEEDDDDDNVIERDEDENNDETIEKAHSSIIKSEGMKSQFSHENKVESKNPEEEVEEEEEEEEEEEDEEEEESKEEEDDEKMELSKKIEF